MAINVTMEPAALNAYQDTPTLLAIIHAGWIAAPFRTVSLATTLPRLTACHVIPITQFPRTSVSPPPVPGPTVSPALLQLVSLVLQDTPSSMQPVPQFVETASYWAPKLVMIQIQPVMTAAVVAVRHKMDIPVLHSPLSVKYLLSQFLKPKS